jgi:hypothetical protein
LATGVDEGHPEIHFSLAVFRKSPPSSSSPVHRLPGQQAPDRLLEQSTSDKSGTSATRGVHIRHTRRLINSCINCFRAAIS